MNSSSSTSPKPRRWRRILVLQAAVAFAGVCALELGARTWLWIRHDPYHAAQTRREALQLLSLNRVFVPRSKDDGEAAAALKEEPDQDRMLHPYLGWEMIAGNGQIDDELQWLHSPRSTGELQIMIVGGSVAGGFSLNTMGSPRLLEILHADPRFAERKMHLMSFARGGYKEPQQINFVNYLLGLGFKPNVVINIDGFNEVALGNNNHVEGSNPVYPSASHWSHLAAWSTSDRNAIDKVAEIRDTQRASEAWGSFVLAWRLEQSCILGKLALHRMYKLRRLIVNQFNDYGKYLGERKTGAALHGPVLEGDELDAVKASVECWKETSRSLSDLCRARGIIYIHVLQPTLHDTGSKPLTAKEIASGDVSPPWIRGAKMGYPLLREAGAELLHLDVDFVDASQIFAERTDDIYYDCCHFGKTGNELLADKIGPELLKRLNGKQ